jgi:hypothetical protein
LPECQQANYPNDKIVHKRLDNAHRLWFNFQHPETHMNLLMSLERLAREQGVILFPPQAG